LRWKEFPDIISDDLFVRLHFKPEERVQVPSRYWWPLTEGFRKLVRVRRRQDMGNLEIAEKYPDLIKNESKRVLRVQEHLRLFAARPVSYSVYASVLFVSRYGLFGSKSGWARGR
jgi:hypothetical protein